MTPNNSRPSVFAKSRTALEGWFGLLVLVAAPLTLFLELAGDVWLDQGFAWDATIMLWVHSWSRPWLDQLFLNITSTGGPLVVVIMFVTAAYFWWQRQRSTAVLFILSFVGGVGFNSLLKLFFGRPRPLVFPPLSVETTFSFPSGHAMSAVVFYGLLAILLWREKKHIWAIFSGLWVFLVALSRVYLGVHFPSDVLASLALGTIWLLLLLFVFDRNGLGSRQVDPEFDS